jgi:hypothetical protein
MPITTIKIFPSIGVARLGNSPDFFVGPEIPGDRTPPPGGYRDSHCRIKRQAARFRLFGFDGSTLVQEVTAADAAIQWTVHVASTKASWRRFVGLGDNGSLRNAMEADRASLEIDPGARTLNGPNQAAGFNTGRFRGNVVPLGEMRTDAQGRLLVTGGFGNSGSVPAGRPIVHYANNDDWHDDVSDGPVTAVVTLNGTNTPIAAVPAWVICPPPDFAPPIDSVTTLYDTLFQVAVDKGWLTVPAQPSFTDDIWPILQRVFNLQRASQLAGAGHFDFDGTAAAAVSASRRTDIFNRLRDPDNPFASGSADMPKLRDDSDDVYHTITRAQYQVLQKWMGVAGTDWINDWPGAPPAPATAITPDGLTRAALEACVGAAFYPGIEASWFVRDTNKQGAFDYAEPFRLDPTGHSAGDVTRQMAVPWQADFWKCNAYGGRAWWPAQRPDYVFPEEGGGPAGWTRQIVTTHEDMVNHWHKLGFVVTKAGSLVETERRVVCTNIFLVTDHSTFSEDEVSALLQQAAPATFSDALYVIAEGFLPGDLGVTTANPTPQQLAAFAPTIAVPLANARVKPQQMLLEDTSLPTNLRQRFTFVYGMEFDNTNDFVTEQVVIITATKGAYTSAGTLKLIKTPNPYMLDGPVSWLSTDVRVFKVTEGQAPFGAPVGTMGANAAAAVTFINNVVAHFRSLPAPNHPFDQLSTDPQASQLQLSEKEAANRIFNFAVARVRYRGLVSQATDVRVFFRLFTVAATGLEYDETSTYRRTPGATPVSLLGLQAGKLVTIPCYGTARVDTGMASLTTQTDPLNVFTLQPAGANEFHGYYGAWLDFNQTAAQFPDDVGMSLDGPWTSGRKSIQELIRGMHQCLCAEVYFKDDLITYGETPAGSDNLAQRNLVIVESGNPGSLATRTIQHPLEIKATTPAPQVLRAAAETFDEASVRVIPAGPDELMLRWNDVPRASRMTLYMPDVDADDVLRIAGQNYEVVRLERVDTHTLRCLPGDVTYVPLPSGRRRNIVALLTLELPEGVKRGQRFSLTVHQISGRPRTILGAFQLTVPVHDEGALLIPEIRKLSVLRHIFRAIAIEDPWHAVFLRYLDQVADRVRGFGGDPDAVAPAADGSGRDVEAERCTRRGWLVSALLALLAIVTAWHPPATPLWELLVLAGLVAVALRWRATCFPSVCQWTAALLMGLGLGATGSALLFLWGAGGPPTPWVLTLVLLGLVATLVVGVRSRCLRLAGR